MVMAPILGLLTWSSHTATNDNVMSRLAAIQSLAEHHTFQIDNTDFVRAIDKVYVGGHFYSDKPPTPSVLGAALYWPMYAAGLSFHSQPRIVVFVLTFGLLGFSFLACLACFHDALARMGLSGGNALWMTTMLALGTLYMAFTTTFNNHTLAASWIFIGFYGILRANHDPRPRWMWLAGCGFALAVTSEYVTTLFLAGFVVCALARSSLRRRILGLIVPVVLAVGAVMIYNVAISGSLRPIPVRPDLFRYPGSHYLTKGAGEFLPGSGYNTPSFALHYGLGLLFGENGFLLYCPILLVAIWEAGKRIVLRQPLWVEAATTLAVTVVFVVYYAFATNSYGGCSYSIRYFVSFTPLLWFFAFPAFLGRRWKHLLLAALFAVSFWPALLGCVNPWTCGKPSFFVNLHRWYLRYHVDGTILEF